MSRHGMPWYKTESRLHRDADYLGMTLEQQAVYRNLLDYANEQRERGSFSVKNTRVLALAVSMGDEQLLKDTLAYASSEWACEDGTTSIVIDGDTARFSQWARIQNSYPSDAPEAVAERVRKHRSKGRNDRVTGLSLVTDSLNTPNPLVENRTEVDKRREEAGRGECEGGMDHPLTGPIPGPTSGLVTEADEILDLLVKLGCVRSTQNLAAVRIVVQKLPSVSALEVALDHYRWQEPMPKKDRLKDQIHGWQKAMQRAYEGNKYQRTPTPPPSSRSLKERPPPIGEEREVLRRRAAAQEARASAST